MILRNSILSTYNNKTTMLPKIFATWIYRYKRFFSLVFSDNFVSVGKMFYFQNSNLAKSQ